MKARSSISVSSLAVALVVVSAACSGASGTVGDGGTSSGGDDSGSGSSSGSSASGSGSSSGSSSGSGQDASSGSSGSSSGGSTSSSGSSSGSGSGSGSTSSSGSGSGSSSGSAGDAGLACLSPADCGSASPVCCGTIVLTGGTPPQCNDNGVVAMCDTSAACPTTIGTTCMGTEKVRLCQQTSDCTEQMYNKCCTFPGSNGSSLTFCANQIIAGFAGATCKP